MEESKAASKAMRTTRKHPVNVADLRRSLGSQREVEIDFVFESITVVSSRSTDAPIAGSVVIESIERGVSVFGSVSFEWEADCRRCLEIVAGQATAEIEESFLSPAPTDADAAELEDNTVDLVPVVQDAIGLAIPLAPLCRTDCAGPDPDRYPTKTEEQVEAERAAERQQDPRWDSLSQLKFDD